MDKIYNNLNNLLKETSLKQFIRNNKNEIQSFLYVKNYNNLISIYNFLKNKLGPFLATYLPKISYEYKTIKKLNLKIINLIEEYINTNTPKVLKIVIVKKKKLQQNSKKNMKHKILPSSSLNKSKKK